MPFPILATRLHIPTPRLKAVPRRRLIDQLDSGLESRLILLAAPAGFGQTTLLSEWIAGSGHSVLWLFLDDGDNDPARFLAYLVAVLRPLAADPEKGLLGFLRTPMPPSTEAVLTALVNGIADSPEPATLVPDLRFTRAESGVNLTAGAHALRIHLTTGGFNLNYLDVRAQTVPQQMLLNGTFSNGLTDWQTYFGAAGLATFVAEANSARIAIAYQGSNVYDIQIFQPVGLVAGKS